MSSTNDLSALRDLLSSIGHTNDVPSSGAPLVSTEQLHRLSEKINEILGNRNDRDPTSEVQPNQLLNEDGLPIIDISEHVDENPQMHNSTSPIQEEDLIPLSLLPPDKRERHRRERDRILDLLEEEELLQQLQEERDAEEERKEAIRKLKESAKVELDRLKGARELQKKMGQALVQHAERTVEDKQEEDTCSHPQVTSTVAKKSVSFADVPTMETDTRDLQSAHQTDWGDVTPGRLRAPGYVPVVGTGEADKYPMKMRVAERRPAATPSFLNDGDSDDESVSSASPLSPHEENDSSDEKDQSSSNDGHLPNDEPLEEGFDFDVAQHHREIALEYHKKRRVIGADTAKAMVTLDDYDQREVFKEQLPLSRFREDRLTAAYDESHRPVSTSIGQTVLPASRQKSLQNSVRLGKLENDQLVGGSSGESGSDDETVREVVHMLKTGRIQNRGPDFDPPTIVPPQDLSSAGSPSPETSTAAHGAKPSRFKLVRGGNTTETTTSQDNNKPRSQPTISNVIERKSPGSTRQRFPINKPPLRFPATVSDRASPMIIDSPSPRQPEP